MHKCEEVLAVWQRQAEEEGYSTLQAWFTAHEVVWMTWDEEVGACCKARANLLVHAAKEDYAGPTVCGEDGPLVTTVKEEATCKVCRG